VNETRISLASTDNEWLCELLRKHPRVDRVVRGSEGGVKFRQDAWEREVLDGVPSEELYGLVEIMDNNPMVCADRVSTPGPAATLALIALAPLAKAGLIVESPVLVINFVADESEPAAALTRVGWTDGLALHTEVVDLDGVLAATAMVSIPTPEDPGDVSALYDEHFGRSFYVQRDETSEWTPGLVAGQPFAVYRLTVAMDHPRCLVTIRLLADSHGKCGESQIVHAMNVMCGFEESLGVS